MHRARLIASLALSVVACDPGASGGGGAGGAGGSVSGGGGASLGGYGGVSGTGGEAGPGGAGGAGGAPAVVFTRYPHDVIRSPFTRSVAERARAIASASDTRDDHVFMKVGASGTVSHNLLFCFAGDSQPDYRLELGASAGALPTIEHFRLGVAGTTTPFDRVTLAAEVGRTAAWVLSGAPSPLEQEIAAVNPRFAFVNYGTNDMEMASSYAAALKPFYTSMSTLLDELEAGGIVPIVTGLNPRGDDAAAAHWDETYNDVTRGLAEARQLAYISLTVASEPLADQGLLSDGLHGNFYVEAGGPQPCVFDSNGLAFNYNIRNQASIDALDAVKRSVLDSVEPDEPPPLPLVEGSGTAADPFVIDRLPFTHAWDTRLGESAIDQYACGPQDESGPEIHYRLAAGLSGRVRAVVLDHEDVDADVHLLTGDLACLARGDTVAQATVPADGRVVVDSYVSASGAQSGEYLLVVAACTDDAYCQ
ncbi:MAG: SGNH/GDSL hydrolase family protein [Polyangiaceae bacterium]